MADQFVRLFWVNFAVPSFWYQQSEEEPILTYVRFLALGFAAALVPASITGPAIAQSDESEPVPVVIVERCAGCHIMSEFHDDDTGTDAPRFSEIMAKSDVYTADRLKRYLANPHWPMSQFVLSQKDIDRVVTYLRREAPAQ